MEQQNLFYGYLENPNTINTQSAKTIYDLVKKYPFSVHVRLIQLMYLKKYDKTEYNNQLSKLALMFSDRSFLLQKLTMIGDKIAMLDEENIQETHKTLNENSFEKIDEHNSSNSNKKGTEELLINEKLEQEQLQQEAYKEDIKEVAEKETTSKNSDSRSEELMRIIKERLKEINQQQNNQESKKSKTTLEKYKDKIEKFINEEPKVKIDQEKVDNRDLAEKSVQDRLDIISETLATIYEKQGNKIKAIEIYKQLITKYPEKSSYFANQIDKLQTKNN